MAAYFWELQLVLRSLPNLDHDRGSDRGSSEETILEVTVCNIIKCVFLLIISFPKSTRNTGDCLLLEDIFPINLLYKGKQVIDFWGS